MDKDRRLVYLVLKEIEEKNSWSNLALNNVLKKEPASSPAFVREMVYGILRNRILLDYNIGTFLKKPQLNKNERILLRMGFYQLALMDGVKDYAAINETVELAKKLIKGKEGFINAILRNFLRSGKELKYPEKDLSVRYSCSPWIVDLWTNRYGFEKTESLLSALNKEAPLVLRPNLLKITKEDLKAKLTESGFDARDCRFSRDGITVKGSGLMDTELFYGGFFSVQGETSQLAVEKLDPKENSVLIDMCAAPGGKTVAAAGLMKNKGEIYAFDVYQNRVKLIRSAANRLGISIINAAEKDASLYDEELREKADYIICDVPCSGLGVIREKPEIKLAEKDADFDKLPQIQLNILNNAGRYLKHGGRLLYSTCTINPAENGDVVRKFLAGQPGYRIAFEEQILPQEESVDGFYISILEKE